jgi:hypothetical protein
MPVVIKWTVYVLSLSNLFTPVFSLTVQTQDSSDLDYEFDFGSIVAPADVVNHWASEGNCEPEYFRIEPQNYHESRAPEWFEKVARPYAQNRLNDFKKRGEASFFGERFLDAPNFHCRLQEGGCGPPDCERIIRHVIDTNPNMPIKQALEEARRRYYIALTLREYGRQGKATEVGV